MRLAVLDIGSNSIHLLVVDAGVGAPPLPATSHKEVLRLAEHLKEDGSITTYARERLMQFCKEAIEIAEEQGAEQILAFATSALRDAPNGEATIEKIYKETGLENCFCSTSVAGPWRWQPAKTNTQTRRCPSPWVLDACTPNSSTGERSQPPTRLRLFAVTPANSLVATPGSSTG